MYFLIEDNDLLNKYNAIWDKVSTDIKKEFDSKLGYNKKFLKTKIKQKKKYSLFILVWVHSLFYLTNSLIV